jgi:hypothetical protein
MTETHPEKRLIGYARVSTYGQTLDAQLDELRAAGCANRNIYREKVTGARADRRELLRMLDRLAPGDVVTVTRIDRLARSTFDLGSEGPFVRKRTVAPCTQSAGSGCSPAMRRCDRHLKGKFDRAAGIARNVIPRVTPPICCVQYTGPNVVQSVQFVLDAMIARNKPPSCAVVSPSSGPTHPDPPDVHVSYRAFSHEWAF